MAKKNLNAAVFIILLALFSINFTSCNSKKESNKQIFELSGTIKNFKDGKLKVRIGFEQDKIDSVIVKDGKFTYKADIPVPTEISFEYGNFEWMARFFAENSKMTLVGDFKNPRISKVSGGKFELALEEYRKAAKEFSKGKPSKWKLMDKQYNPSITEKEKKEIEAKLEKLEKEFLQFQKDFIKKHPKNPYGSYIIWNRLTTKTGGESAKELKKWADPIDPSIRKHPFVAKMFKMLNMMLETEAGLDKFVAGVKDVQYKVDKTYGGAKHKNVVYLSMMNNDNLCALVSDFGVHDNYNSHGRGVKKAKNFFVQIINPDGKELSRFNVKANGLASCIAVDSENNIYVLATLQKEEERKFRGKVSKYLKNVGAECLVYNKEGKQLKRFELEGRKYATGARIYKDKLLVSDVGKGALGIYNKESGKLLSTLKDLRPCCSILDFDIDNKKGQILVANLGSFRVDGYELSGKKIVSFGKRGRNINDFHSCCNPVSVRRLNNGAVITVEKTPTRIKVYSQQGAKFIKGIKELVKGCFHIPIMSDSKSNIYLASPEKGLVKCIPM